MPKISTRGQYMPESPIRKLAPMADAAAQRGTKIYYLNIGQPDIESPSKALEAVKTSDLRVLEYSPSAGFASYRKGLASYYQGIGLDVQANDVIVTTGGSEALSFAMGSILDPGDEVIVPAPYWTTYPEAISLAGGVSVVVDTTEETEFKVTVEQLEKVRTPRTKVLLFVSPDNPSGAVYSPEETIAIGKWAVEHGIWVVTDEIYEHLTYGKHKFSSMPTLVPELADKCVIVNGVAKTYAMTGWRVGWMIGPKDVMKAAINFQSHTTSNVSNVAQIAALEAVSGDLSAVAMMRESFERRGTLMHKMLTAIPGVTCMEPQGAFYCFPNVRGLLGRDIGGKKATNSMELADLVLDVAKVAFVPGEAFGAPGYARFSFALGDADLVEGMERLAALFA